jgi:hypothetical protein
MNSQNPTRSYSNPGVAIARDAEATLRLIANLPAPEGLEDRVLAGLSSAPRSGRVLEWPGEAWLRTAAAAAIVFAIVGGGWGIYSRVQPANAVAAPPHVGNAGGFSNAGAVRVPQTVPSTVVAPPGPIQQTDVKPSKKVHSKGTSQDAKADAVNKAAAASSAPATK